MSHYKSLDFKGERLIYHTHGFTAFAPAGHKYLTPACSTLSKAFLTNIPNLQGGSWNGAGTEYVDTAAPEDLMVTGTNIEPFAIRKQQVTMELRNNHDSPAFVTIYEIAPRDTITDSYTEILGAASGNEYSILFKMIMEGIADKISAANMMAVHTVNNAATRPTDMADDSSLVEFSMHHGFTIFDSSLFGQFFKVTDVAKFYLRETDRVTYKAKGGRINFMDGVAPYVQAESLAFDFTRFYIIQVRGEIGHEVAYTIPGTSGATSLPHHDAGTWTTATGDKGKYHLVTTAPAAVDVLVNRKVWLDVFDATLIDPLTHTTISTSVDHNDMLDTVITAGMDLE